MSPPRKNRAQEAQEQRALVHWFGLQYPHLSNCLLAIKNEWPRPNIYQILPKSLHALVKQWLDNWYKKRGGMAKAMGVRKGTPDLFLAVPKFEISYYRKVSLCWVDEETMRPRFGYSGLFIELKPTPGPGTPKRKPTKDQVEMMALLEKQGYKVALCHGWGEAQAVIKEYLG